jgi:trans-aconitate 2-methyltransferase
LVHVLRGENPVLEWFQGGTLRPFLELLDAAFTKDFLREAGKRLKAVYPFVGDFTL